MPFLPHFFVILLCAAAGVAMSELAWPANRGVRKCIEGVLMFVAMATFGAIVVEIGGLN